jgi:hypothetical protein
MQPPRFIGARWRGERHQRAAQPCCDALFLIGPADCSRFATHSLWRQTMRPHRQSGFVICDGAGGTAAVAHSAARGSRAAWRALQAVQRTLEHQERRPGAAPLRLAALQRRFQTVFFQSLDPAGRSQRSACRQQSTPPRCDHTVLACLWDRRRLLVAQVGDSSLLVRRNGLWQLPIAPHKGECANETSFLRPSTPPGTIALWSAPASEVEAVIGFSDGLEPAFLAPCPDAPERLLPNAQLAELLHREHRRRCGWRGYADWLQASLADPALAALSDDDRTLVIATR